MRTNLLVIYLSKEKAIFQKRAGKSRAEKEKRVFKSKPRREGFFK